MSGLGTVLAAALSAAGAAGPGSGLANAVTEVGMAAAHDDPATRFKSFFEDFSNAVRTGRVADVYAENAYLNDTLKEIQGVGEIEAYFLKTLDMATTVTVEFEDAAVSGSNYYFRWTMDVVAPKLNGGNVIRSQGMSHVLFDDSGKVAMHRDYWDSSSALFEHIPVLGGMIRWVKGRL